MHEKSSGQVKEHVRRFADSVVCLSAPDHLGAVGAWYRDFAQVSDAEALELPAAAGPSAGGGRP